MEIAGFIIFAVIGTWAGWQTGTFLKGGDTAALPKAIIGILGAVAGGMLFWILTINIGGLIGSMVIAVLGGIFLLFLMGFFKKTRTR